MLAFRRYVSEGGDGLAMPVISISKETIDLSQEETCDEINDNLYAALEPHFLNPYVAWIRASKLLALYGVSLPRVIFDDIMDGEEVVAISQFGEKHGVDTDGTSTNSNDEKEYYFYFSYGIAEDGHYECYAVVTDDAGLDEIVSDETEDLDPEGEKQPPQE
jgi:hypothetical protein